MGVNPGACENAQVGFGERVTRVLQIGNFRPPGSTENDIFDAFQRLNVEVVQIQESDWANGLINLPDVEVDMVMWTRTPPGPDHDIAEQLTPHKGKIAALHLDRWSGLRRMADIYINPYWRWIDRFYTADPQIEHWTRLGVDAVLTPPAVSERWLIDPDPVERYSGIDIAFVGNYQRPQWNPTRQEWTGYHVEHQHRFEMLDQLTVRYGNRFNVFPPPGAQRIIGQELAELYASIPIIIGDSCLVGLDPYLSDRVPETIGRGGFLMHPHTYWNGWYEPGVHLIDWRLYDWEDMFTRIDHWLDNPDGRQTIAAQGAAHVREHHTYTIRLRRVLEDMVP